MPRGGRFHASRRRSKRAVAPANARVRAPRSEILRKALSAPAIVGAKQEAVSDCKVHKLVVDVALVADEKVLFVRYADTSRYDGQGGWFLPDDYLDHLEHPDDAARRIMRQQAHVEQAELRLGEIESFGDGAWHLVFHYVARLDSAAPINAHGNVATAEWFPLSSLPAESETAHNGWPLEVLERVLR